MLAAVLLARRGDWVSQPESEACRPPGGGGGKEMSEPAVLRLLAVARCPVAAGTTAAKAGGGRAGASKR